MDGFFDTTLGTAILIAAQSLLIVGFVMISLLFLVYGDRKIWAAVQMRRGPNVVGPFGLLQSVADALKYVVKEIVIPAGVDRPVFFLAPMLSFVLAILAWAVIPFHPGWVLADINVAILFVMAISSLEVYGVIMGGWASNSKYAFLGGMRSAAQLISYEVAMGLALVVVLMVSNSLNLGEIVKGQGQGRFADMGLGFLSWNWLSLLPMFVVYLVSCVAETNRAPFDMAEGESEIVGFHVDYSGMAFAVFSLAEYSAMLLCSTLTSLLFLGGWLSPVGFLPDSIFWLFAKISAIIFFFFWIRATFPRYRYDQIMRLGWKVFIPVCLIWLVVVGFWMMSPWNIWK